MPDISPEKRLLDFIKETQGRLRIKKDLKIFSKINIVLVVIIVVILLIFLVDFFTFKDRVVRLDVKLPEYEKEVVPVREDFEIEMADDIKIDSPPQSFVSAEELEKDLQLMGIISGQRNQAIIEDKTLKKTFFLYEGDTIKDFKVQAIKDTSVILEYKGTRVELRI